MRYKKLTFLKVPFDNTYTNVYTFPELSSLAPADIAIALINYGFDSYVITAEKNRYFRITNGNVIMSVPATYDFIRKFNYVIAQAENPDEYTQFYFVTGYSTLNTGEASTTNINIQFDAYMNNYYAISTVQEKYTQIAGHVNDIVVNNGKIYPKNMYPIPSSTNMIESNVDCGRRILWLELTLDGEGDFTDGNTGESNAVQIYSVYGSSAQLPIVLVPVAVFDTLTMRFVTPGSYQLRNLDQTQSLPISNQIYEINGLHVIQARYTYSCPFNYDEFTDSNGQKYFLMESLSGTSHYTIKDVYLKTTITETSGTTIKYSPLCQTAVNLSTYSKVVMAKDSFEALSPISFKKLYCYVDFNNFSPATYATPKDYDETLIPEIYRYPFVYYKVICGNEQITIYPPEHCEGFNIYEIHEGYECAFQIEFYDAENVEIYSTLIHPRNTTGFVPVVSKSEDIYMRNNGNSLTAQIQLAYLNHIKNSVTSSINYLSSGAGAVQSALTNPANGISKAVSAETNRITDKINNAYSLYSTMALTKAKIEDIKNSQDAVTNAGASANKNALSQDSIIVRKCFIDPSCTELQDYALSIYKNGINTNVSTSLLGSGRAMFFFRKLLSCHIPTITNNDERNEVENIFTEGATFWKLKNYANEADKTAVRTMQKIRHNPEYA